MQRTNNRGLLSWWRSGEPMIWANATAVALSIAAVGGVLLLIAVRGFAHFWPSDVAELQLRSNQVFVGEISDEETLGRDQYLEAGGDPALVGDAPTVKRWLVKTGNRRINPPDFRWVFVNEVREVGYPVDLIALERTEWGNAYGRLLGVYQADEAIPDADFEVFLERLERAKELRAKIDALEGSTLNSINYALEQLRLERKARALSPAGQGAEENAEALAVRERELLARFAVVEQELKEYYRELSRDHLVLGLGDGQQTVIQFRDLLRGWQPNAMSTMAKLGHYARSIWLFLSDAPREANTEGGVFPALFGTVMMVLLMSVLVTPFGVIAAIYLREYATQGLVIRIIRIAVNNLAGVPSIVFGVFGLGFFVYFLGGSIDSLFFEAALPSPTFGTPGLLWASLTLALLTVPVVIVSTEEGLSRIPRSLREGSLALGATKG